MRAALALERARARPGDFLKGPSRGHRERHRRVADGVLVVPGDLERGRVGEPLAARARGQGAQQHLDRRSEEHTSELQSHVNLVCRLLLEKKKQKCAYPSPRSYEEIHVARSS